MWAALTAAWQQLPATAGSSRALVAYVLTILAWTVIAWRVKRNQSLLAHISKFPEHQRLDALKAEMGVINIPVGLTPEMWLRDRAHRLYLYGFIVACVLVLALFVTSAITRPVSAMVVENVLAAQEAVHARQQASLIIKSQEGALEGIRTGQPPEYITSRLGPPVFDFVDASQRVMLFTLSQYQLKAIFLRNQLYCYVVASTSKTFKPWLDVIDLHRQLGTFTFWEASGRPLFVNMAASGYQYVEQLGSSSNDDREVYISYSSSGINYEDKNDYHVIDESDLEDYGTVQTTTLAVDGARRHMKPNSYAVKGGIFDWGERDAKVELRGGWNCEAVDHLDFKQLY